MAVTVTEQYLLTLARNLRAGDSGHPSNGHPDVVCALFDNDVTPSSTSELSDFNLAALTDLMDADGAPVMSGANEATQEYFIRSYSILNNSGSAETIYGWVIIADIFPGSLTPSFGSVVYAERFASPVVIPDGNTGIIDLQLRGRIANTTV